MLEIDRETWKFSEPAVSASPLGVSAGARSLDDPARRADHFSLAFMSASIASSLFCDSGPLQVGHVNAAHRGTALSSSCESDAPKVHPPVRIG